MDADGEIDRLNAKARELARQHGTQPTAMGMPTQLVHELDDTVAWLRNEVRVLRDEYATLAKHVLEADDAEDLRRLVFGDKYAVEGIDGEADN